MPKLQLNPIVLIVINILAPSMYIFLNGSFLKIYLVIFATVLLLAMGCYKSSILKSQSSSPAPIVFVLVNLRPGRFP